MKNNVKEFNVLFAKTETNRNDLSNYLKLSQPVLRKSISGERDWKVSEMKKIKEFFKLSTEEFTNLFF